MRLPAFRRNFNPNLRQIGKQMSRPAIDVALAYVMAHALHAFGLLRLGTFQRPVEGCCELRNVVGIHQQRIGKLLRGPRKGAEDERAPPVVARGNEFLGHQIHSVMKRRDHAERGRVVIASDFFMRMMPLKKHNWFPARRLEARVNAFRFRVDLRKESLIALYIRAARGADLHERETLLICRMPFQKTLDGIKSLEKSFGVIHTIDSDTEKGSFNSELGAQSCAFRARA